MTYLILFLVAGYLFQVNPVLCIGLVGAVVFFKIRGFFGGRHVRARTRESRTSEAALVAMCIALLERSERTGELSRNWAEKSQSFDGDDPLEGLFLD